MRRLRKRMMMKMIKETEMLVRIRRSDVIAAAESTGVDVSTMMRNVTKGNAGISIVGSHLQSL